VGKILAVDSSTPFRSDTDFREIVSVISLRRPLALRAVAAGYTGCPWQPSHQKAYVNDRPFLAIMLILVMLLALASWQFYSLVAR
jgi:hypothetical protein